MISRQKGHTREKNIHLLEDKVILFLQAERWHSSNLSFIIYEMKVQENFFYNSSYNVLKIH